MARLYLFAEGQTEQTFAHNVLRPHLANHGVYMQGAVLIAHAKKRGKVHRGGGRNYLAMKNDIQRFTKHDANSDAFFTTMIDLYAIPAEFPGQEEAEKLRNIPPDRVRHLEDCFGRDVGDPRFIPHIQLHEFETYLFCRPEAFGYFYDNADRQIAKLKADAEAHGTPELIDDGQSTAPSKRIIAQFPDYEGAKVTIGAQVAQRIGARVIREKCPHFDQWLKRLEALA
jgi:uncharacterized protein DUF4276